MFALQYYSADYISDILKTARALNMKDEDIISTVTGNELVISSFANFKEVNAPNKIRHVLLECNNGMLNINYSDVIAFTAHAVFRNYTDHMTRDYNDKEIDLLVSGGGARNNCLMR